MLKSWIAFKSPSQCPTRQRPKARRLRQAEIKELAEIALTTGVVMTIERDGTRITVGGKDVKDKGGDLDRWLEEHSALSPEGN